MNKQYTYSDFVYSRTAEEKHLNNTPPENLYELNSRIRKSVNTLNAIAQNKIERKENDGSIKAYSINFVLTSGYRSVPLNRLVGGVRNSAHMDGVAVDIVPTNMDDYDDLCDWIKNNINPYKLIRESSQGENWIHVTFVSINSSDIKKFEKKDNWITESSNDRDAEPSGNKNKTDTRPSKVIYKPSSYDYFFTGNQNPFIYTDKYFENQEKVLSYHCFELDSEAINKSNEDISKLFFPKDVSEENQKYLSIGASVTGKAEALDPKYTKLTESGQFLTQDNFNSFWSENYEKLISDPLYIQNEDTAIKQQKVNATVWIYSKVKEKMIDVTPFLISVNTSKSKESSSFSLVFPKIDYDIDLSSFTYDYVHQVNGDRITVGDRVQPTQTDFISSNFQWNDLVYIRFENLKIEGDIKESYQNGLVISNEIAPTLNLKSDNGTGGYSTEVRTVTSDERSSAVRIWDMIGLIDTVSVSYDASYNYVVNISGRDLSKVLEEDSNYFIPLYTMYGDKDVAYFPKGKDNDRWFRRNMITGQFNDIFTLIPKQIKPTFAFIFSQLCNLGCVPDDAVKGYTDALAIDFDRDGNEIKTNLTGVYKTMRFFIDQPSQKRSFSDSFWGNPEGTIQEFCQRICQYPFVEFWGDTYTDTYDFIVRQPPFTESAVLDVVNNKYYIDIKADNVYSYNLTYDTRYFSWYRLHASNEFYKDKESSTLAWIPIAYYEKYAQVFGNKKLEVPDMYLWLGMIGTEESTGYNIFVEGLANDLMYMIETNAYLPFTRRGTITMNGDRRIKIGTFVKLESTNELFYVTDVNQSYDVITNRRYTTISVVRGMIMDYIKPSTSYSPEEDYSLKKDSINSFDTSTDISNTNYSYFSIVDIKQFKMNIKNHFNDFTSNMYSVTSINNADLYGRDFYCFNEPVFDFFLKRRYLK